MILVDTNILVYAADADSPFHAKARSWLNDQRARVDAWYISWSIVYEFLRVTTHPRVMRRPWSALKAWSFISTLLASPGLDLLVPTERHFAVAEQILNELPLLSGNRFHDAHIAILMREHGVRQIVTHDVDFHRFSFLDVVNIF